jgi:hypothetical protein
VSKQSPLPLSREVGTPDFLIFDSSFCRFEFCLSFHPQGSYVHHNFSTPPSLFCSDQKLKNPDNRILNLSELWGTGFATFWSQKWGHIRRERGHFLTPFFGVRFGANIGSEAHSPPGQAPFWTPVSCTRGPPLAVLTGAVFPDLEVREPLFRGSVNLDSLH